MILAAAVKYRIEATGAQVVLCGARHCDIISGQLPMLGFLPKQGYEELEQGFIDSTGRFMNRQDAYGHALQCGQIPASIRDAHEREGKFELMSEDIW